MGYYSIVVCNQPEIQNRFVSPDATYINISVVIISKIKNFYAKQ